MFAQQIGLINLKTIPVFPAILHGMKLKNNVLTVHLMEQFGTKHLNHADAQQLNLILTQRIDVFLVHHKTFGIKLI